MNGLKHFLSSYATISNNCNVYLLDTLSVLKPSPFRHGLHYHCFAPPDVRKEKPDLSL